MEYDVFISYSSKDKDIAYSICDIIEANNLKCWIAPRDITGGKTYAREIIEAINEATVVLFIFSEDSNKSAHVENEIDNAFNAGKTIIPFRISESTISPELKYYLNKKHWVNGVPHPHEFFVDLLCAIKTNIPRCYSEIKASKSAEIISEILNNDDEIEKNANMLLDMSQRLDEKLKYFECDSQQIEEGYIQCSKEERYDIVQTSEGIIMIIIGARKSEPYNPRLVYDGGAHALLYRNTKSAVLLNSINIKVRSVLKEQESVSIVELLEDDVLREYTVKVRIVKNIESFGRS